MSVSGVSTNTNLKGKRKKKIPPNANPLFTQWLTEWKQEAAEKGWKSAHTYAKALKTIKMFPLPLASGKDCRLLQNFGDKICKMLDEKLREYKCNQGMSAVDLHDNSDSCSESDKVNQPLPSKFQTINSSKDIPMERINEDKFQDKNTLLSVAASSSSCLTGSHMTDEGFESRSSSLQTRFLSINNASEAPGQTDCPAFASVNGTKRSKTVGLHDISDSNYLETDLDILNSPVKKMPRTTSNHVREYVPAYRSGPYALILALYRYMQDAEFKGYLTKSELSHAAQPFSDKSFIVPDSGSRYTAWSSMGTLIKKGFILKTNNPARYALTGDGYQLGERLYAAEMQSSTADDISDERSSKVDSSQSSSLSLKPNLQHKSRERRNSEDLSRLKASEAVKFLNLSSDSEDGDMSRAITESLLSYSQKESVKISPFMLTSNAGNIDHTTEQPNDIVKRPGRTRILNDNHKESSSSSSIINTNNEGILIVSDDEDDDDDKNLDHVHPASTWARYHTISPSQSSPPERHVLRPPSQKSSLSRESVSQISASSIKGTNTCVDHLQIEINSKSEKPPQFSHLESPGYQKDVMEISDDDSNDIVSEVCSRYNNEDITHKNTYANYDNTNKIVMKVYENITNNSHESDDDELPDLELPLSKRLLQSGHVESGLLRSLTSSLAPQTSAPKDSVNVIDKPAIYQDHPQDDMDKFTNLKIKPVCLREHITYTSDTVMTATVSSNKSQHYKTSSATDFVVNSYSTAIHNIQTDKAGINQKDVKVPKTIPDLHENLKQFKLSASSEPLSSETASVVKHCPAFTFQPGAFDIILCLDNREFYGSKGNSKTLLPELMKNGILCDLRLLHVGDLLWIARERVEHQAERSRELVLHYIIERKRMDDLVSSMTDGRLKEQKFRLKHCGLSETIILIEEYGSTQNFSISEDRIKQSIANSQIVDGFKVKRCDSAKDAVTYLVTMTNFLRQYYSTKTLHAVSLDHLKLLKGQQTLHKTEHFLIPFDVFNEASVKHKDLTVKEMFAKQLIQIPGVSADRAKAITNVYPSFSVLMAAYERCADDKERQKLLSGIKCGKKERNLGIALSQLLCMLYTQKSGLS